ncbi:MAG: hypothetical protein IJJ41_02540 [Clostridia bacterium]|nr:hypothetical protein [Clostridia bacterium]
MLKGIAVSGGFAIGKILKLEEQTITYPLQKGLESAQELARLEQALAEFTRRAEQSAGRIRRIVGKEEADIFTGHIYMANDPFIARELRQKIQSGYSAEMAMESACDSWIESFSQARAELTRQKAADIADIKKTVLGILSGKRIDGKKIPFGTVLAAKELTPSAVNILERRKTLAVLSERGSPRSHFAILVKAMEIPAVVAVEQLMKSVENGQRVIVDANKGEVIPLDK